MKKTLVFALIFVMTALSSAQAADLSNPTGLSLSATSTTIKVSWTVSAQDIEGYYISYAETGDNAVEITITYEDPSASSYTITGLIPDTDYEVTLAVYNGNDESTGTKKTITTTDLDVSISLIDQGTIRIDMSSYESTVNTYDYYVGTRPMSAEEKGGLADYTHTELSAIYTTDSGSGVDVEDATSVTDLEDGTYYILVKVHYNSGNTGFSDEIEFDVSDFGTFFSQTGDIENGCFINSVSNVSAYTMVFAFLAGIAIILSALGRKTVTLLVAVTVTLLAFGSNGYCQQQPDVTYNNMVGIKAGYFEPSESMLGDNYDSIVPVSLFYERMFGKYVSMDISGGYTRAGGNAVTSDSEDTGVDIDLDVIPISASLNLNVPITPLITYYFGLGGDYWFFEEKAYYGEERTEVGGYHGKTGLKLFTGDTDYFKRGGILIEANYAVMDRFGDNDVDLGGWTYSLGVMYCF